jgi:hypothetical protein
MSARRAVTAWISVSVRLHPLRRPYPETHAARAREQPCRRLRTRLSLIRTYQVRKRIGSSCSRRWHEARRRPRLSERALKREIRGGGEAQGRPPGRTRVDEPISPCPQKPREGRHRYRGAEREPHSRIALVGELVDSGSRARKEQVEGETRQKRTRARRMTETYDGVRW